MNATRPITRLIGAVLVVAACASAPAATTVPASSTAGQPSNAAATTSAKPSFAQAPSATPAVAARCDNTAKPFDANDVELTGPWAGDETARGLAAEERIGDAIRAAASVEGALAGCDVVGGTATRRVAEALAQARERLATP